MFSVQSISERECSAIEQLQKLWLQPKAANHPGYSTPDRHRKFHPVTLTGLASCGTATAQVADAAVRKAVPEECLPLYNDFDHQLLTNNLTSWDSIFMQEKNVAYLDPMHIAIQEAVMKSLKGKNSLLNKKKVIKFVQREEEILAVCLANYLLFSPMSAWDFQIKGLCHQGVEKKGRLPNLIKLETHMSFVNPLMKGPKENNKTLLYGGKAKPTVSSSSSTKEAEQEALDDWKDHSERACGILMMPLSPGQKTHISNNSDDPAATWKTLKGIHEAQHPGNHYNTYDDLFSIRKQPDETLAALIMRTEQAVHLFKIFVLPSTFTLNDLDAELPYMALIHALPDEFTTFTSTLMLTDKLKKVDLVAAFHTEEVQRHRRTDDTANVAKANAAVTNKPKPPFKTFYCTFHKKDVGHSSDRCFLSPDFTGPRPPWFKPATSIAQQAHIAAAPLSTLPALSDTSVASNSQPSPTTLNTGYVTIIHIVVEILSVVCGRPR
ncbi:hypothetical protein FIBSPDRAFT_943025 [Athelia psychrophila]|uniref:Uncharacterized protein n=1 Tax=Athelia psychrophila TaxID=1759441 RepID=A0A166WN26_9AGAM|nr:hypothetical protein FIBSPDRAFT_943025 [Fibularhizoctonia sp. CBS 109695]